MQSDPGLPSSESLILVTLLKTPRDLEIARLLGWYRIPLRSAPRVVAVDYLAFYQTAAFGDGRWQIEYIAPVRGHELATRRELLRDEPDHPHADREYYKIQLGTLVRLPQPVLAKNWRRLTFLYTTGDYLLHANTLHDLVLRAEERQDLWRALRERSRDQSYTTANDPAELTLPDLDLPPDVLAALLGICS